MNNMMRILATVILIGFILFTSPIVVFKDIYRVQNPPVNPNSIDNVSMIPNQPSMIEEWVNNQIEYEYDFGTYGVFWYIPTPDEVLEKGRGDCKSRAILLASILEKKGVEYQLHISTFHWWVSYPEKKLSRYEKPEASVKEGENWKLPDIKSTLDRMWSVKDEYYSMTLVAMPLWKKIILIIGLTLIWLPKRFKKKLKSFLSK